MNKENSTKQISETRLIFGSVVFITGFLLPLTVPLVAKTALSTGLKTTISGLLILGIPEIFMLITVAILGKDGYQFLKQKVLAFFKKHGPPDTVGKTRYLIGLICFSIPILTALLMPYFDHFIPGFQSFELYINIGGDVLLLFSLLILGGDFWDKIRSLFIHQSKAHFIIDRKKDLKR